MDDNEIEFNPRNFVTPICCEDAKVFAPIKYSVDVDDETGSFKDTGKWYIALGENSFNYLTTDQYCNVPSPKWCPFCGTPLPEMVKKKDLPPNLMRISGHGNYCDNCKERCMCCNCLNPAFAFEPKHE